ncbi:nucleotide-diphospho-sugar transferase [Aspergillus lucknowensis]|uniref:Nucleotide-diphospho-sugar transferase n=1 Tax=Aspergillus lucknowensis TaxID=176173 RepID=A0ABR4LNH0_9EURO
MTGCANGMEPNLEVWLKQNRFHHSDFSIPSLANIVREKNLKVTVLIPCKEVGSTIRAVIEQAVQPLLKAHVVNEVFVIDAASADGTAAEAVAAGAQVLQRAEIAFEDLGHSRGKGDAMWRGLLATSGDVVAFLDGDTKDPVPAHLLGILGPLLTLDHVQMVRSCYDRPFQTRAGDVLPHEGGRVTELLARPVLNMHWPELAGFRQPLAGEFAARRTLLEQLAFPVGYGVEIGTLIDAYRLAGLHALAEVDVGQRQNDHKPLRDLTFMAYSVLAGAEKRRRCAVKGEAEIPTKVYIPWLGEYRDIDMTERPPLQQYRGSTAIYPSPPFVAVEGVRMFRDIGGNAQSPMRRGLVFRSGDPSNITQKGLTELASLCIKKIFDLRSLVEINAHIPGHTDASRPSKYPDSLADLGIDRFIAPVFPDEAWQDERRAARLHQYANAAEGYAEAYLHTLSSGIPALRFILHHLAQREPSPVLIHCTAGKDRTGVVAMLILLLAGCDDESIAEEYALNDLDSNRSWGVNATQRLLRQPGLRGNVGAVENIVRAKRGFMLATLRRFREVYGTAHEFLQARMGLDEATIMAICGNLIRKG